MFVGLEPHQPGPGALVLIVCNPFPPSVMTGWSWEPWRQASPPRDYSPRIYSELLILREENFSSGGKIRSEMVLFSLKLNFQSMFLSPPASSPDKHLLLIYIHASLAMASPLSQGSPLAWLKGAHVLVFPTDNDKSQKGSVWTVYEVFPNASHLDPDIPSPLVIMPQCRGVRWADTSKAF